LREVWKKIVTILAGFLVLAGAVFAVDIDLKIVTVDSTNDVGYFSSIALDSNGYAHISYYDATNGDLRYCNNTGGTWSCAMVDNSGDVGHWSCIAIDSNDIAHISYYNNSGDDLCYCNNSGGIWNCESVMTLGDVGQYSSIAVDSNNVVQISSHRDNPDALIYCNNSGGAWNCVAMEDSVSSGKYSSIAVDSVDIVHIAHYNSGNLRYCNNTGGTWGCTTVRAGAAWTSIAIDSNDFVHIIQGAYYCNNTGGAWTCEDVGSNGYNNLALDSGNVPHLSFYNDTTFDFEYINKTSGIWGESITVGTTTQGVTMGRGIAIKEGRLCTSSSFSNLAHMSYYCGAGDLRYARSNTLPTQNAELYPAAPITGKALLLNCTVNDTDFVADILSCYWNCYKDSVLQDTYSSSQIVSNNTETTVQTIPSSATAKGQAWYCTAWGWDKTSNSASSNTTTRTIGNTAPTLSDLGAYPNPALAASSLVCRFIVGDNDTADSLYASISWYKNGVLDSGFDEYVNCSNGILCNSSIGVPSASTSAGEKWYCSVNGYDGTNTSGWSNSSNTTIIAASLGIPDFSPASISISMYSDQSTTQNLAVNNTGDYNISSCNFSVSGSISSYVSFNSSVFTVEPAVPIAVGITIANPAVASYNSLITLNCVVNGAGSEGDDISQLTVTSIAEPVVGGGGGGTTEEITVLGNASWRIETVQGSRELNLIAFSDVRKEILFVINPDILSHTIVLNCTSETDICSFVELSPTEVVVKPGVIKEVLLTIEMPSNLTYESFLVYGIDEENNIDSLGVTITGGVFSIFGYVGKLTKFFCINNPINASARAIPVPIILIVFLGFILPFGLFSLLLSKNRFGTLISFILAFIAALVIFIVIPSSGVCI